VVNKLVVIAIVIFLTVSVAFASETDGTINSSFRYAWGSNFGWINFKPDAGGLLIHDTYIGGYAWSTVAGWINFAPTNGGVTNNCDGELGGYAWSANLGWIPMSGASINSSGIFTGIAGSSTLPVGKINFNCDNCKVETDWRPCSLRTATSSSESSSSSDSGSSGGGSGFSIFSSNGYAPAPIKPIAKSDLLSSPAIPVIPVAIGTSNVQTFIETTGDNAVIPASVNHVIPPINTEVSSVNNISTSTDNSYVPTSKVSAPTNTIKYVAVVIASSLLLLVLIMTIIRFAF
jgi:hypothetical protein